METNKGFGRESKVGLYRLVEGRIVGTKWHTRVKKHWPYRFQEQHPGWSLPTRPTSGVGGLWSGWLNRRVPRWAKGSAARLRSKHSSWPFAAASTTETARVNLNACFRSYIILGLFFYLISQLIMEQSFFLMEILCINTTHVLHLLNFYFIFWNMRVIQKVRSDSL